MSDGSTSCFAVVLDPQMGDLLLTHQPAKGILELGLLDEQIVLGIEAGSGLGTLEVEREPLLNPAQSGALSQIEEQRQVQDERRRQNRVATEEIDLDLHRVAQPPEDVDVVPAFLIVASGRIVVRSEERHV